MKLVSQAFSFGFGTFISRILGFLRDATVAYFFGASHITDAFFVAFRLPNSFRRLIGEGGFNAVFVPLYTRALEEGKGAEFLARVFGFYITSVGAITLFSVLFAELIIALIAPGLLSSESYSLSVFMARFLFAYMILVGVSSMLMGILNVHGKFFIPALAQAVFNGVFVIILLILAEILGYKALIVAVLLGGLFQVLINVPSLLRSHLLPGFRLEISDDIKKLLRRMVPALGGFGVSQLSIFIDTFLASFVGRGAISYLYYAGRLYHLPFGLVSASIANSLLPLMSKKDADRSSQLTDALRLIIILIIPSSAGLFMISEEIIDFIYGRGSFAYGDVLKASDVLAIYSLGLPFMSLQKVLTVPFFSRGDTSTPLKSSLIMISSEAVFASVFAFLLGLGLYGLPAGTSLSAVAGFVYLLRKKDEKVNGLKISKTLLKVICSTLLMSIFIFYIKGLNLPPSAVILLSIFLGGLLYFGTLFVLGESLSLRIFKSFIEKVRNP